MSETMKQDQVWDIAVIGGGAAGLAAAALAARSGKSVVVLEKAPSLGGRSASRRGNGAVWNLGAHALYRGGAAERVLARLNVSAPGGSPGPLVHWVPGKGETVSTPGLLLGRTLNGVEKRRFLRFYLGLRKLDPHSATGVNWNDWMASNGLSGRAADVASALARLSTYVGDNDRLDAGVVLRQLRRSVVYPHGGWQTIVDGLAARAAEAGAVCRTSANVTGAERAGETGGGWAILLSDGERIRAGNVIAAVEPALVARWFGTWLPTSYEAALRRQTPVYASTLDLHLRRLPQRNRLFALGLDRPLYFSVHSHWSRLCDDPEHAVVHVMRYDGERKDDPEASRGELERFLDRLQPGWRELTERARYLPHVTVMHGLPDAGMRGVEGRPAVDTGIGGVYVAGDWAGPEGILFEASLASAEEAARLAVQNRTAERS
ncbi:phytoene desaturase family protein [Cohnella caldifontis]|uniref:phytoene desaturase family protein n=1 Tax=Cohnella caldifontis TaxID=3027471 RepID=UPI0023EBD2DB|nr:FAD-dependent oxidoreductase [Cohnella sp. YIM B05605]